MKKWKALAASGALLGAAALGACSSEPNQTVDQACAVIGANLDNIFDDVDPETFAGLSEGLDDITAQVHNPDVREAWIGYADAMKGMAVLFGDMLELSDDGTGSMDDIEDNPELLQREEELYNQLGESGTQLSEYCGDLG